MTDGDGCEIEIGDWHYCTNGCGSKHFEHDAEQLEVFDRKAADPPDYPLCWRCQKPCHH